MNDEHDRATAQSGDPHDPAAISRRRFLSTVGAGVGAAATIGGLSGDALAFADGLDPVTGEIDAGLLFLAFQQHPETQFVRVQKALAGSTR